MIDLDRIADDDLPLEMSISAITLAELTAGPHATTQTSERVRRQSTLQRAEASFDPIPFDAAAARAYGEMFAGARGRGRKARGGRAVDLLIAASAVAAAMPLFTCNPDDFRGIDGLEIVAVKVVG